MVWSLEVGVMGKAQEMSVVLAELDLSPLYLNVFCLPQKMVSNYSSIKKRSYWLGEITLLHQQGPGNKGRTGMTLLVQCPLGWHSRKGPTEELRPCFAVGEGGSWLCDWH